MESIRKSLKSSGIIDLVAAALYVVLGIVLIVLTNSMYAGIIDSYEGGIEVIIIALVFAIFLAMLYVVAVVLFVEAIISLGVGINSIVVSKKEEEVMKKKRKGLIVSVVFEIICAIVLFLFLFLSIIALSSGEIGFVGALIISIVVLVLSIIKITMKIKAAKALKTI